MRLLLPFAVLAGLFLALDLVIAIAMERPLPAASPADSPAASLPAPNRIDQSQAAADAKSAACLACHHGIENMHNSPNVVLGCADCHGGDGQGEVRRLRGRVPCAAAEQGILANVGESRQLDGAAQS
jgi:cytochrome c553